jgi:multidrug efflux pump subunit AcrB
MTAPSARPGGGPLAFMATHPVAANLLMAVLAVGGLVSAERIRREVLPEASLDQVAVFVWYPGATPSQVEEGLAMPIERELIGLDSVTDVAAYAEAEWTWISADVVKGRDAQQTLEEVKTSIDRLGTLPATIEPPSVTLSRHREPVMTLVLYGPTDSASLRRAAEAIAGDLGALPEISTVKVDGLPDPEIQIDVDDLALEQYGLDVAGIAQAIRSTAVAIPGGRLDGEGGQLLLHVDQRRIEADEYADVPLSSLSDGRTLTLGEVATFRDSVANASWGTYYDGQPSARIQVYRVGDERPLDISRAVRAYQRRVPPPDGLQLVVWDDHSEAYAGRMGLLFRNAAFGLVLMLVLLGLFLAPGLGFWVTLGIPISFLGAFIALPWLGVSLNMISLFGFIVALGIVVDDAIVVGEAVHKHRRDGKGRLEAALAGAREVAQPVTFSVITTVIAFVPIALVSGVYGKFFVAIPFVVIPTLLVSLVESLFILPAHLSEPARSFSVLRRLERFQQRFSHGLEWFVEHVYGRLLDACLRNWSWPVAASVAALALSYGVWAGGHLRFNFFPKIEEDTAIAGVQFPVGTPNEETEAALDRIVAAAHEVARETGAEDQLVRGVLARKGLGYRVKGGGSRWGSHVGSVFVHLTPMDERPISTTEFSRRWRAKVGRIAGADALTFSYSRGFGGTGGLSVELSHPEPTVLEAASSDLAERLRTIDGVVDVDDGFSRGKGQLDFELTPAAEAAGLTYADLATQIRNGFFGAEVLRQVRGRSEVKVFVRRSADERRSEYDLERLLVRTPDGGSMPLLDAAVIHREAAPTRIVRRNGRRIVTVEADVNDAVVTEDEVQARLEDGWLQELGAQYAGLRADLGRGREAKQRTLGDLQTGGLLALLATFALLAVASRSYLQPLLVVAAIPFGVVGAVGGHLLLGMDLSLVSVLGMVALAGVVVNDSLVLVAAINDARAGGATVLEAVRTGAQRRFRPIVLTSLTTFFGLLPMMFETSVQARFLSPMAVSLGFGVLVVTFFALLVVPVLYVRLERLRQARPGAWLGWAADRQLPG